eukprot:5737615-Pleurochrysis_carterae.AAC.1
MQISQVNALHVLWGMVWALMAIGAAKWLCAPPTKRQSGTRAVAAIAGARMAKVFGSAAYAIFNEPTYYYHCNLRN